MAKESVINYITKCGIQTKVIYDLWNTAETSILVGHLTYLSKHGINNIIKNECNSRVHWLSCHGLWAIIPCSAGMVRCTWFFGAFNYVYFGFLYFWRPLNRTLELFWYEMIIVNSALHVPLAIYHLISMLAHGIILFIVKC